MATEQLIGENTYRTGQINAKQQFHIARRLAPIVGAMTANLGTSSLIQTLYDAVSQMRDEDTDYIMRVTLSVCTRKQGDHWMPVWNRQADEPQFADINAAQLLELMIVTIQDNMQGFTSGLQERGIPALNFGQSEPGRP